MYSNIAVFFHDGPTIGHGHRVRSRHLAGALGATLAREGGRFPLIPSTVVLDFRRVNNPLIERLKWEGHKVVIIVGVGHSVTEETHELADLIVYQCPDNLPQIGRARVLSGLKYALVDPRYIGVKPGPRDRDALVYFGAGYSNGYTTEVERALLAAGLSIIPARGAGGTQMYLNLVPLLPRCRLYVGSMGMTTYEALACGTYPVVSCVDMDHAEGAAGLHMISMVGIGMPPVRHFLNEVQRALEHASNQPAWVDGHGVERVARVIRQL